MIDNIPRFLLLQQHSFLFLCTCFPTSLSFGLYLIAYLMNIRVIPVRAKPQLVGQEAHVPDSAPMLFLHPFTASRHHLPEIQ